MAWIANSTMPHMAGCAPLGEHSRHRLRALEEASHPQTAGAAVAVLDALAVAIVVVDASCNILHVNAAARVLLQSSTAFVRSRERLVAASHTVAAELSACVARIARGAGTAVATGQGQQLASAGALGLHITVLGLAGPRTRARTSDGKECAAILIRAMEARSHGPSKAFLLQHRITKAEARVLARLMAGDTLQGAADALGLAPSTIKTHVQHLFSKTGTKRQAELVLLAMSSSVPPAIW